VPFQKKEINHINHPFNYKNLPVRLKRKSRLKSIKKRGMISTIPKKLTTTTHLITSPLGKKAQVEILRKKEEQLVLFQKKEINHINHPSNYKNLPVCLTRKSRLKSIKKRGMISTIPKERN
jgi:hypothetical protein